MENQIITNILLEFLTFVPPILFGVYISFYCAFYFNLYKKVETNRISIRSKILDNWSKEYQTLQVFFSKIHISDIRLVALSDKRETKRFRRFQFIFFVLSIISCIGAIIVKNITNGDNLVTIFYICAIFTSFFIIYSYYIGSMTFYEWKFYSRLDKLNEEIE